MHSASEHGTLMGAVRKHVKPMKQHADCQKGFEIVRSGVFAPPGLSLSQVLIAESGLNFTLC